MYFVGNGARLFDQRFRACETIFALSKESFPSMVKSCQLASRVPLWVVCHERSRSTRLRATVREMKEGPSGSAIRSLIPSHRELLRSKAVVVSVAETSGQ